MQANADNLQAKRDAMILMSERFKPTDLKSGVALKEKFLDIMNGHKIVSADGEVTIERQTGWQHRGEYELRVPKSKQRGGKYSTSEKLLSLVEGRNFESKGNSMAAYISERNLRKAVEMLSRAPYNVSVLEQSKLSDAEEGDILYRDGEDEIAEVNSRFNEELEQQVKGDLPNNHIYKMGMPSEILLSAGVPYLPIQMSAARLKSKSSEFDHDFNLTEVRDLVKELQQPMAIFSYGKKRRKILYLGLTQTANNLLLDCR